jgi:hypothetical protein
VQDVDGDGAQDVLGFDWNTIGHKPGDWQVLGPAHAFRLDADGNDVWVRTVDAWWSNQDILVRGGSVLVVGADNQTDGLWRLDAGNGSLDSFLPFGAWKALRGPVPVHVDGQTLLALPVRPLDDEERGAILLLEA